MPALRAQVHPTGQHGATHDGALEEDDEAETDTAQKPKKQLANRWCSVVSAALAFCRCLLVLPPPPDPRRREAAPVPALRAQVHPAGQHDAAHEGALEEDEEAEAD